MGGKLGDLLAELLGIGNRFRSRLNVEPADGHDRRPPRCRGLDTPISDPFPGLLTASAAADPQCHDMAHLNASPCGSTPRGGDDFRWATNAPQRGAPTLSMPKNRYTPRSAPRGAHQSTTPVANRRSVHRTFREVASSLCHVGVGNLRRCIRPRVWGRVVIRSAQQTSDPEHASAPPAPAPGTPAPRPRDAADRRRGPPARCGPARARSRGRRCRARPPRAARR
jgi:hypothetical protein